MEIKFVDAENADLLMLAAKLDEYYFEIVGEVHKRYAKYNDPHLFGCRAVVYIDGKAAGCGCWKRIDERSVEVKRIYVLPEYRRQGVASAVIGAVERDAAQHGYTHAILETARTTADSAALYLKLGYRVMPYYGSPAGADNCLCFEKELDSAPEAELKFVDVTDADLAALVAELDVYFRAGWGEVAEKYKQYHALDGMACAVVAYIEGKPAACGCWRAFDPVTAEIKRMYVRPAYRRQGIAGKIVAALEQHAAANGCHRAVLETGADMPEAIAFYEKQGYRLVPNYGDFVDDEICVCMEKQISDGTMR